MRGNIYIYVVRCETKIEQVSQDSRQYNLEACLNLKRSKQKLHLMAVQVQLYCKQPGLQHKCVEKKCLICQVILIGGQTLSTT